MTLSLDGFAGECTSCEATGVTDPSKRSHLLDAPNIGWRRAGDFGVHVKYLLIVDRQSGAKAAPGSSEKRPG
jgi:hypothetical protein